MALDVLLVPLNLQITLYQNVWLHLIGSFILHAKPKLIVCQEQNGWIIGWESWMKVSHFEAKATSQAQHRATSLWSHFMSLASQNHSLFLRIWSRSPPIEPDIHQAQYDLTIHNCLSTIWLYLMLRFNDWLYIFYIMLVERQFLLHMLVLPLNLEVV